MIPPDENHEFVKGTQWEVKGRGMSLIYRRIHPLKPSYTVVAYGEVARGGTTIREAEEGSQVGKGQDFRPFQILFCLRVLQVKLELR